MTRARQAMPVAPRDVAYQGYLIRSSPFRDTLWIERDGITILASVATRAEAVNTIDRLRHDECFARLRANR